MRIKLAEVELSEDLRPVRGLHDYQQLRLLARLRGRPLAWAHQDRLHCDELSAEAVRSLVEPVAAWHLLPELAGQPMEADASAVAARPVSIVVCVRTRPDLAELLLRRLVELDGPAREIVAVLDDRLVLALPRETATSAVRLQRVRQLGPAEGRNVGLALSHHPIVAFLDEAVLPDGAWLTRLSAEFDEPRVAAVMGLIVPAELETPAQWLFDWVYGGLSRRLERRVLARGSLASWQMLAPETFGSAANMAFRREALQSLGGFDRSFDVAGGAFAHVDLLHRAVADGLTLIYEPTVLARQIYPQDLPGLYRHAYAYGRGYARFLRTCGRNQTVSRAGLLRYVGRSWLHGRYVARLASGELPRRVVASELAGALVGLAGRDAAPGGTPAPDGVLAPVAPR